MSHEEIIKRDVTFGPFKTEFHSQTINERFRLSFYSFLENKVLPHLESNFTRIEGGITTDFDDPKFFGPLSLLRFCYKFHLTFHAANTTETAWGDLVYDPKNAVLSDGRNPLQIETLSFQKKQNELRIEKSEKLGLVVEAFLKGARDIPCPYCGELLRINAGERPLIKSITCNMNRCMFFLFD